MKLKRREKSGELDSLLLDDAAATSKAYRTLSNQFAFAGAREREQWCRIDEVLKKGFSDEERKAMWGALDTGLVSGLPTSQRDVMEQMREYSNSFPAFTHERIAMGYQAQTRRRLLLAASSAALVLALAFGWAFRWQVVESHAGGQSASPASAYLVNRWTGEVRYLFNEENWQITAPWSGESPSSSR